MLFHKVSCPIFVFVGITKITPTNPVPVDCIVPSMYTCALDLVQLKLRVSMSIMSFKFGCYHHKPNQAATATAQTPFSTVFALNEVAHWRPQGRRKV